MMMKPLGAAAHPLEETIEQVIRDAPLFRGGRGMVYGPVSGGISNENWRVQATDGSGDWFVKVPGQGTEMFIDRRAALDASQKAAAAGPVSVSRARIGASPITAAPNTRAAIARRSKDPLIARA